MGPTAKSQKPTHNLAVQILNIDMFLFNHRLKSAITTICCLIEWPVALFGDATA